jgi:putative ABC transport system substrate-binding protein
MKRRTFITGLGSTAAWPVVGQAQQPAMPVIGFLSPGTPETRPATLAAVRRGLAEAGFVEGRNVSIEYRWAGDETDRMEALAAELVGLNVRVIIALGGERGALAAKTATTSIPIVFGLAGDPTDVDLVQRLNRPGRNLTGATTLSNEVAAKSIEMLHELIPSVAVIALLVDQAYPGETRAQVEEAQNAARVLGVRLLVLSAHTESEIEAAFAAMAQERVGGLVVSGGATFIVQNRQVVALAAHYAIPATYPYRESAVSGGLMSYGMNVADAWRLTGVYAGRILKGETPANLPVQQATKIELIINMKTANTLGLTFPLTLLGRADEVIE